MEDESKICDKVMKDGTLADIEKDVIGAKYLQIEKKCVFPGEHCVRG